MLSNAYFLAKFRFDTAENEPAKNLQNFRKMHYRPGGRARRGVRGRGRAGAARREPAGRENGRGLSWLQLRVRPDFHLTI